jgi:hypothetical protein
MTRSATLTGTPADLIGYQRELIRTKQYRPIGRIKMIQFDAASADWIAPPDEPFIAQFGRLFDFRHHMLPLAESLDGTLLLPTAPMLVRDGAGGFRVGLEDVPDPNWKPDIWTPEESRGEAKRDPAKDKARMIPQRLEDRAEKPGGRLGVLEGTNFLVFQPLVEIMFQAEILGQMVPGLQKIRAYPDTTENPARHMCLLVDPKTGETLFFGGRYELQSGVGIEE